MLKKCFSSANYFNSPFSLISFVYFPLILLYSLTVFQSCVSKLSISSSASGEKMSRPYQKSKLQPSDNLCMHLKTYCFANLQMMNYT